MVGALVMLTSLITVNLRSESLHVLSETIRSIQLSHNADGSSNVSKRVEDCLAIEVADCLIARARRGVRNSIEK